jgi:hypothetical protein
MADLTLEQLRTELIARLETISKQLKNIEEQLHALSHEQQILTRLATIERVLQEHEMLPEER